LNAATFGAGAGGQRLGERAQPAVQRVAVQDGAHGVGLPVPQLTVGAGAHEPVQQRVGARLVGLGLVAQTRRTG
jgi:hypothetical protein